MRSGLDRATRVSMLPVALLAVAACRTAAPEAAPGAPEPPPVVTEARPAAGPAPAETRVRVTAGTLNVRGGPSTKEAPVTRVGKGTLLTVLGSRDAWLEVRVPGGQVGWVHSRYTAADEPCLPDKATAEVLSTPPLSFSELSARGTVRIEAEVDADGTVEKTTVAANTTGSEDAALLAEAEVRQMKFSPPVRRCRPVRFIYVYTRTF
jgi:uncharacterized protein YgiM (DUF1202 family)